MRMADKFGFFNPKRPYTVTFGELPHWEQEGATYFITFRTADSLPVPVIRLWERERHDWLLRHGIDSIRTDWRTDLRNRPHDLQREFHRLFATKLERSLDECHGECLLNRPELASIVANSLLHFDGESIKLAGAFREPLVSTENVTGMLDTNPSLVVRYHISDFVIMPNHVHVMVCFLPGIGMLDQCYSWKKYTSGKINKLLGRSANFWQSESFDHLVRDVDHFERFRKYIAENCKKANLKPEDVIYYRCPDC